MKHKFLLATLFALIAVPVKADITIGLIAPLTGQYAVFGEQLKRGAEQAVQDINAAGGIKGQKIELRVADDACDPKQAVAVAGQMASAGVKYVVGHYCSGTAIPSSKVMMEEGILLISPAATNPKYTDEAKDLIFRVCGRDDRQGVILGEYILQQFRTQKIAIIHDKSAYGKGVAEETKKTLNVGGVTEVLYDTYAPGERDYAGLITKLKQNGVQVLFIGGYHTEAGLIARQLKEQNAAIQMIGGDALVTDEFWSIAGKAGEGVLMSFGPDPRQRPEAAAALKALRQGGYEPEGYTLYTYAAFQVLAEGLRNAAKPEPLAVAAALRAKPTSTVLGILAFDAKGDIAGPAYVMYRWHDGKYEEIKE